MPGGQPGDYGYDYSQQSQSGDYTGTGDESASGSKLSGGDAAQYLLPFLGMGFNAISQGHQNKKQREYNTQMYERQRADALSDWNMQNLYNSPSAQMDRYKKAGLNPNLIYGQQSMTPSVRTTDSKSYNPQVPRVDPQILGDTMNNQYDLRIKNAQADLIATQQDSLQVDMELKKANTLKAIADTARSTTTKDKIEAELNYYLDTAGARQELIWQDIDVKHANSEFTRAANIRANDENIRREAANLRQGKLTMASLANTASAIAMNQARTNQISMSSTEIEQRTKVLMQDERVKRAVADAYGKGMSPMALENLLKQAVGIITRK